MQDTDSISPIVSPRDALQTKTRIVIDARGGADALDRYHKGHIEHALFVDLDRDLSRKPENPAFGGRHPLPDLKIFGQLLGSLGITPSSYILVYDDKGGANAAARFWWMMKSVGHKNIQVVDGGLDAIVKAGATVTSQIHSPVRVNDYPVDSWLLPTVSIEQVKQASVKNDSLILDVREAYRYRGESEPIDLVAGHIPGAINVPYIDNLSPDGSFRSPAELKAGFERLTGLNDPGNVIVHCGSGVTACHTLLAMDYAGLPGSKLYVGSWGEWSRRELPIAREIDTKTE